MSQEFPNRLPELPIEKLQVREDEYMSEEFLMILFSLLESKGFTGFNQLQAVVDDPKVILKILRLMHGMQFKVPTLTEFSNILQLTIFIYATLIKDEAIYDEKSKHKVSSFVQYLNYSKEDYTKYTQEVTKWRRFLEAHGYNICAFIPKVLNKKLKQSDNFFASYYMGKKVVKPRKKDK